MDTTPAETPALDQHQLSEMLLRLRGEQNLPIAILAGSVAAVLGGILWAVVTVSTEYQIGFMAVGIGLGVGFAVRLGKGVDKVFGILGGVLSLIGCVLGNFFSLLGFIGKQESLNLFETLSALDYSKVPDLMISASSPIDLLFYGIAVYEGYKFSFRKISPDDVNTLQYT